MRPGEFHHEPAPPLIAEFVTALLGALLSALVGRAGQPQTAGDLAAVAEAPPTKQFVHQQPRATDPDPAQPRELRHRWVRILGQRPLLRGFDSLDLPLDQGQPRTLALDLPTQAWRQLYRVPLPPALPVAPAHAALRPQVMHHQQ